MMFAAGLPAIEAWEVTRRFHTKWALAGVELEVMPGEIHALLGPNGAGKTTLLRMLTGLVAPTSGYVAIAGRKPVSGGCGDGPRLGLVPSGDRSFYLRLSGVENLAFFARLHGMRRRAAVRRAGEVLDEVGLSDAATTRVGVYSHGMQKRLSAARALLNDPQVLLVDEATHDLDPPNAERVRDLVKAAAHRGAAVLWTTQRVEEIAGFAHRVTLLESGEVRFRGSVPELMAHASPRQYMLRLRNGSLTGAALCAHASTVLAGRAHVSVADEDDPEHVLLSLEGDAVLGDVVASLAAADMRVIGCSEARSSLEEAFRSLTSRES